MTFNFPTAYQQGTEIQLSFSQIMAEIIISQTGIDILVKKDGNQIYLGPSVFTAYKNALSSIVNNPAILTKLASYTVDATITSTNLSNSNVDNVLLMFEDNVVLFAKSQLNAPVMQLSGVKGWRLLKISIDGNKANQTLGNNYVQAIQIGDCIDCEINGAIINNAKRFGVYITGVSNKVGIINSKVLGCDWNGISLGSGNMQETGLYATNNEIAYSSDVGIAVLTQGCVISYNNVHDMNGILNTMANWGIAVEIGGSCIIFENTISRCRVGIMCSANPTNIVSGENQIISNHIFDSREEAIEADANSNIIKDNEITEWGNFAILLASDGNQVLGNTLRCSNPNGKGIRVIGADNRIGDIMENPNTITLATTGANIGIQVGGTNTIIDNTKFIGGSGGAGVYIEAGAVGTIIRNCDFSLCMNSSKIIDNGTGTIIEPNNIGL